MTKIVNVNAVYPINGVKQIVRGKLEKVPMATEDIFRCLCAKARVEEVIGNKTIPLDFNNYDKNNKPAEVAPIPVPSTPKPVTQNIIDNTPKVVVHNIIMTDPPVVETMKVEDSTTVTEITATEEVPVITEEQTGEAINEEMTAIEVPVGEEGELVAEDTNSNVNESTENNQTNASRPVVVNNRKNRHK